MNPKNPNTLEKIALFTVKAGLWVIPILPLYLSPSMLFPFITGKNFAFRIMVEIIAALWAGLALMYSEYRPRLTLLFRAVTVFIVIIFLADLFGPNPYRSFFSNYERMEGFMMLFHLYLYFVVLVGVFRSRRDWLVFFYATLAVSMAVSGIALLQKFGVRVSQQGGFRVDATIGNPTYLAAYLMFHVWLACLLAGEFWKRRGRAALFAAAGIFELAIIYFTATRGAVLAFLAVSFLLTAGAIIFWKKFLPPHPRWRAGAGSVLILLILIPGFLWSMRNSEFTRIHPTLYRLTQYSLQERTVQSRFKIWAMSAHAALERPILGWGQENYYLVFQKYYDPGLYAQEPWFDRSHNVFLDWLVHTGFLGLGAFMSLFVVVFRSLLLGIKKGTLAVGQGVFLMSAFVTYLLQDIFVFDNLNTYLLLFALLAYAQFLDARGRGASAPPEEARMRVRGRDDAPARFYAGTAVLLVIAGVSIYFFSWRPMRESRALIRALTLNQSQSLDEVSAAFRDALSYRTFGDTEVREQMANAARAIPDNPRFTPEEKKRFIEFTLKEFRKQTSGPAKDVKHLIFLASVLDRAIGLNPAYAQESNAVLREAIAVSPSKQIIYFELAQLYLTTGNAGPAIEALRTAWHLDRMYAEAGVNLLRVAVVTNRSDVIDEVEVGLDPGRVESVDILSTMAAAYNQSKHFSAAARVFERLIILLPREAKYRAGYAAVLGEMGRVKEAAASAEEAARLDPAFRTEAEKFIKSLR